PDVGTATPPAPPSPPNTPMVPPKPGRKLVASPVLPEVALAWELAPESARLVASPLATASPVSPESPEPLVAPGFPDTAGGTATPPSPPVPPTTVVSMKLAAVPVSPETEMASEKAPELAMLWAPPKAAASPVSPESPEPLVAPELPEMAVGSAAADDEAAPVMPKLVALDWALASPELPVTATGDRSRVEVPPSPPLASALATLLPPAGSPVTLL